MKEAATLEIELLRKRRTASFSFFHNKKETIWMLDSIIVQKILYKSEGFIRKNASTILTCIGAVGVVGTAVAAAKGTTKADILLKKAKEKSLQSVFVLTTQTADWFEKLGFKEDSIESLPPERKKLWTPKRNSKVLRLNLFP